MREPKVAMGFKYYVMVSHDMDDLGYPGFRKTPQTDITYIPEICTGAHVPIHPGRYIFIISI